MTAGHVEILLQGLANLLELLHEKGMYHPTEDINGERRGFLSKIADKAFAAARHQGAMLQSMWHLQTTLHDLLGMMATIFCANFH